MAGRGGGRNSCEIVDNDVCFMCVQEYGLLVTGHSLGAGTAAILSVLLDAVMPVQCIAYSPPGWLVR